MVNYYTKHQIDSLISNINLVGYHIKTEVDTRLHTNYPSLSFIADMFYSKAEIDSTYTTPAQLHTDFYSKVKTHLIFDTYTTTTQLYDGCYNKTYIDNVLSTSTQAETLYYNNTDTDNLLADKISGIGDISLPGMLDIGTSDYTNSRIRCNANLGGYTGYAELRAAISYDMSLNLSTTRTDGGWMYFRIDDNYMQLSSSDTTGLTKDVG